MKYLISVILLVYTHKKRRNSSLHAYIRICQDLKCLTPGSIGNYACILLCSPSPPKTKRLILLISNNKTRSLPCKFVMKILLHARRKSNNCLLEWTELSYVSPYIKINSLFLCMISYLYHINAM